jgi:long-chain fatty acid transport protein
MEMRMGALRYFFPFILLLMLASVSVFGSGFSFDGIGVKANGMGGAFRAVADDWSAAYYNPAGYSQIQDNLLAGNVAFSHNRYWTTPNVLWGGVYETGFYNSQHIANHHNVLSVPQGGILARLPVFGDEMVMGFSVIQLFDQNQSWELYQNLPAHNSTSIRSMQYGINLDAVAFQLTAARGFMEDKLSVGIGLSVLRGDLIYHNVILRDNPMPSPISDRPHDKIPQWYKNDGNGWGYGYRLGLLYDITERLRFGITYAGKASIDLSGSTEMEFYMGDNPYNQEYQTNQQFEEYLFLGGEVIETTAEFESSLDLPATLGGGISYRVNDRLTLALDAEMVFWSQFKGFDFKYTNFQGVDYRNISILTDTLYPNAQELVKTDLSVPIAWENAGRVMLGANYHAYSFLDIRAGFGADKSALKWDNTAGITQIPQFLDLGTKYTYSFGFGFAVGVWNIDFATIYTSQPDFEATQMIDQDGDGIMDSITGLYEADNYRTVLGLSYRF